MVRSADLQGFQGQIFPPTPMTGTPGSSQSQVVALLNAFLIAAFVSESAA